MAKKKIDKSNVAAENRRARHDFAIEDVFEAGVMLSGTEVKSLREGKATIAESYASAEGGELWLINCFIPEYDKANRFNHEERRRRKLLMHRREIDRLANAVQREGMTLIPLKMFFNAKGIAKLEIGLAKGKKLHDKRETDKQRDWNREKQRLMKRSVD
ncbi:MAG: SsrA-binding protein SmpB [Rhodobacteraceae bacterium]|nr:SsrA-binding protein SmpB [Paracoccaceae bacterium]